MRKRLFEIIETAKENDKASQVYDVLMMITIIVSIVPLAFKESNKAFEIIDIVTVCIFIIDYILRLCTADLKLKKGLVSFVEYPFTPMAIIDLLSILPSLVVLNSGLKLFKLFRLIKTLKVFKVFKIFKVARYSNSIGMMVEIFKKRKEEFTVIIGLAIAYILVAALVILNVEPDTFNNYFDAVYWASVSLTTMGYGDIYPVTTIGRIVTILSSFIGIAIVALPAGLITSGLIEEIEKKHNDDGDIRGDN